MIPLPAASSRGRSKRADPTDSSTLEGYYAAAWVAKVERIGALNFPEEARRRNLTGSLRLSVVPGLSPLTRYAWVADALDTINYELACGFGMRLPRVYL